MIGFCLVNSLSEGTITVKLVLEHFAVWRNDLNALRQQLDYLIKNNDLINTRVTQMKRVFEMDGYQSAANIILQLVKNYNLQGDFDCAVHAAQKASNLVMPLQQSF